MQQNFTQEDVILYIYNELDPEKKSAIELAIATDPELLVFFQESLLMLNQLDKIDFEIIFVTAHDAYAIRAFKYSAVDYLLKPIDLDELDTAIKRLEQKRSLSIPSMDNLQFLILLKITQYQYIIQ